MLAIYIHLLQKTHLLPCATTTSVCCDLQALTAKGYSSYGRIGQTEWLIGETERQAVKQAVNQAENQTER